MLAWFLSYTSPVSANFDSGLCRLPKVDPATGDEPDQTSLKPVVRSAYRSWSSLPGATFAGTPAP
jgi:hypothetical protein